MTRVRIALALPLLVTAASYLTPAALAQGKPAKPAAPPQAGQPPATPWTPPQRTLPAGALLGGGATFPIPLYERWVKEYKKSHPAFFLDYQPIGSARAYEAFEKGTLDIAGTDVPIEDKQLAAGKVRSIHLPTTLGAVVPIYNLGPAAGKGLRLSGQALAEIYLGKVTSWDDPMIAIDNPTLKLPKAKIRVIRRSDPSGITFVWTDYLSKVSPRFKQQVGVTTAPSAWPYGEGAYRNVGVAEMVKKTPLSIGYVELSHAIEHKLPHAAVKNPAGEFVQGSFTSVTAAAAGVRVPSDYRVSITNAPGKGAYPIASYTWLLVNLFMTDKDKSAALRDFLGWAVTQGQKESEALGFARLPEGVAGRAALDIASLQ